MYVLYPKSSALAVSFPLQYTCKVSASVDTSFGCEMCLDMVLIAETYAECDEAKVEHILENECDKKFSGNKIEDKTCRASVDKIAHVSFTEILTNSLLILDPADFRFSHAKQSGFSEHVAIRGFR